ncbi:RNA polymerase sigma factor [Plastoroseomonas hellenica]|uniref:RNA polymerase sigma factor n=1 Tax=Plastoroseomonas hellenica TaxID=2687306 RepID=UPI001BACFB48|nr:sigma-70 family RNA polymerase sigma factor [Plastoroseomonas hellenica]MBR0642243.1 sigma-70 family RNA polymerase sigma factor [Plastoroseomonas hellenica]
MSVQTSSPQDRSRDVLQLLPRLIAYARGLGCSEEDAPSLVRDAALEALTGVPPDMSLDDIGEVLRRGIGIRCLAAGHSPQRSASSEYLEGTRLAHQELQLNLEALDRIDPNLRRVFVLRIFNRMGFSGIAKALKIPLRQVKIMAERAVREIASMRGGGRLPAATLRIASTTARMAPVGNSTPPAPRTTGARVKQGPVVKPLPPPAAEFRVVNGGKKWNGSGMA